MHLKTKMILGVVLVVGLTCWPTHRLGMAWPEPRPLGTDFELGIVESEIPDPKSNEEPAGAITLQQAVSLALVKNPELMAFSWEVRAREASTLQARLLPNPEISTFVEDVGGSGAFNSVDQAQSTIQLSQLIELGGKRSARTRVASLTRDLASRDYETKRIDVLTQVSQSFTEVLSGQERLALTEEMVRLAEKVTKTVSERVKAGKVSPIEETKANVALSSARIELERAKGALEASRKRLAATWGSTSPRFEMVEGDLDSVYAIPSLEQLVQRLTQNPEIVRWAVEMSQRQAVINMEKSKAIPDITISGGYRRFNETDDNAFVVGVSIPLPFFNRNQGGILEARHRLAKAEKERRAAEVRVTTALAVAFKQLSTAYSEVTALKTNILPGTQSVFDAVNEGYQFGKFGYLDVLDAQRTLFDARLKYLQALSDYHKAVADVERWIGEPLSNIQKK